jgi:hypothetical protein
MQLFHKSADIFGAVEGRLLSDRAVLQMVLMVLTRSQDWGRCLRRIQFVEVAGVSPMTSAAGRPASVMRLPRARAEESRLFVRLRTVASAYCDLVQIALVYRSRVVPE